MRLGRLGARTERAAEKPLPPLPDDVKEIEHAEGWRRGAVSFDIVIDKNDKPYVVEIQGVQAGVWGATELDSSDMIAGIPTEEQPDLFISPTEAQDERARRLKELNELKERARKWGRNPGYHNPSWFEGHNGIAEDKRRQARFIPDENCPETVTDGNFEHLFLKGPVIVKPANGSQGKGIRVFDAAHQKEARAYANEVKKQYSGVVAQQFIESRGADFAKHIPDLKGNAQSLRLIVPFNVNDRGEIEIEVPKFGYQRVARYNRTEEGERIRGKRVGFDDASVVNLSRDSASIPMSDDEYEIARPVVLASIGKLRDYALTQPQTQAVIREKLNDRGYMIRSRLRDTYDVSVQIPERRTIVPGSTDYATVLRETLEDSKRLVFFLRFVERELDALPKGLWRKALRFKTPAHIERIPGTNDGRIRIPGSSGTTHDLTFPLRNPDGTIAAGSLKKTLEEYARNKAGVLSKIFRQ